jgi:hypothetical protein
LIPIGLALLVAQAHADGGAEDVSSTPSAGEFSVKTAGNSRSPGEPIRYQYAYGPSDANDPEFERKLVAKIIGALPEKSDSPHVIDVFAEDTPTGRAEGEAIASRVRGLVKTLAPSVAGKERVAVLVVPVPPSVAGVEAHVDEAIAKTAKQTTSFAREFRRAIARPASFETGTVIGTYRLGTTFATWISTAGVHPLAAVGITAFETTVSTFHATFPRSMSGVFGMNLAKLGGPSAGRGTVFIRRQIYALIIAEIERLVTGTPNGFDPIDTWQGQAQIMAISLVIGGLDATFAGVRDARFLEDPAHFARLYLANFFLLTPWQLLDQAGTFPVLLDLTVYKVRFSTLMELGTYFGMYQAVSRAPGTVGRVLDAVFDPIERVIGTVKRSFGQTCGSLFRRPVDGEI